jgi:hypothetical protein
VLPALKSENRILSVWIVSTATGRSRRSVRNVSFLNKYPDNLLVSVFPSDMPRGLTLQILSCFLAGQEKCSLPPHAPATLACAVCSGWNVQTRYNRTRVHGTSTFYPPPQHRPNLATLRGTMRQTGNFSLVQKIGQISAAVTATNNRSTKIIVEQEKEKIVSSIQKKRSRAIMIFASVL